MRDGGVGEVRTELQEERTEVPVDAGEIILVHQGGGPHDPGIGPTGLLVATFCGCEVLARSLLGLVVGGLLLLPFVRVGGFGAGDALVLAGIGAWLGWPVVLWAAWWGALVGAALALIAK
ncbi:MAG: hypothetical protein GEU73_16030 [Chloroflexi bacterium]|nr:hypothetical protein [Chloroflexota bacterium]